MYSDDLIKLKRLRTKFPKNIFLSYINIKSVRNKIHDLSFLLKGSFDVVSIAETKLADSFPVEQFRLPEFGLPYRLDLNKNSGGLLTYVKSDIPSRLIDSFELPNYIQILPIELNVRSSKWLIVPIYRPPRQNLIFFLDHLSSLLEFNSKYENVVIIGDFNAEPSHMSLCSFMEVNSFVNHIKSNTCMKSNAGKCIDLILSPKNHNID